MINDGIYDLASNPNEKFVIPQPREDVPYFDFSPLKNALAELEKQASAFENASGFGIKNPENNQKCDDDQTIVQLAKVVSFHAFDYYQQSYNEDAYIY